jgi:hypothetical protein
MNDDKEKARHFGADPVVPANAREFTESLERRRQAQDRLEQDLLNDVPLLYGLPGDVGLHDPRDGPGDPGIMLARIHREDMLRRNGVDAFSASGDRSEVRLPFERTVIWLMFLVLAVSFFARLH